MFTKKCPRCKKKVAKKYDFCPFCGNNISSEYKEQDYGILGKNDLIEMDNPIFSQNSLIDNFIGKAIKEIPSMIKMIERQMSDLDNPEKLNQMPNTQKNNLRVQLFVNGKKIAPEKVTIEPREKAEKPTKRIMTKEKIEKIAKLPKKEPISKMKRLGAKIIYELEVPGVNDLGDVLITRLENSIEIKALSEERVYSKILNVNLPIIRYGLANGSLILELQAE